ncbi:MAG TPA: ABC transporter substrate-binding protein [Burkholderiales bacterium]|jgi:ABC-type nitrate/sulfonate/bicarbonate transport system substrate-binding protein|nr:ABC transporter substrate-binding protein [Burkholderiales bacterium]
MRKLISPAGVSALAIAFSVGIARADPVRIRAAWVVPVANWPSIMFEKAGLARHAGKSYTFEAVRFSGTSPMIAAMASGELEIANLAFPSFALAVQNAGMNDLRIIADEFQDGVEGYYSDEFFVLKESPIRSIKDLRGRTLATNAAGSNIDIVMRAALKKTGLDEKKDVSFVEAAFPNMKAMLLEKKVDLIPGIVPFSFDPELRARSRVLFSQKQIVGRTQMILWAAREDFITKNRAALVDFMEDALRAARWWTRARNHKEAVEIAARVSKRPSQSFEKWLLVKAGQNGDYYRDPNLRPNLRALQANVRLQHELGFLNADIDVRKHADLSLVREAGKRLK